MSEGPRLVTTGSINGGETLIQVDVTSLGSAVPVYVTLSEDYVLVSPPPPGFPTIPGLTGVAHVSQESPGMTIPSGTRLAFLSCEAAALVAADAASYS